MSLRLQLIKIVVIVAEVIVTDVIVTKVIVAELIVEKIIVEEVIVAVIIVEEVIVADVIVPEVMYKTGKANHMIPTMLVRFLLLFFERFLFFCFIDSIQPHDS